MNYRVGMGQILVEGGQPEANLRRAVAAIRQAAKRGCRLVVLPECLDLGWTDPSARTMKEADRKRLPQTGWIGFLQGDNPSFPEQALRHDLESIRIKVAGLRADTTTPDTRLADDPMKFNPANAANLVRLMMGGIHHGNQTLVLHARLRYFDPESRRPGLPRDVAALVEKLSGDQTVVTLVNLSPVHARRVMIQAGSYGEHEFTTVATATEKRTVNGRYLELLLEPGAGSRITLGMKRYTGQPSLSLPW